MITEDYVSFEICKSLKEKGFDEECQQYYGDYKYPCPTLQMAIKWLREEKKLFIIIQICFDDDRNREPGYYFEIWQLTPPYESPDTPVLVFDTYEQACEAAIKYCLENLI